jgi:hypothetical protein
MRQMKYMLPGLAFLAMLVISAPALAENYPVSVSVDGKGHVTVEPDPVPNGAALQPRDHVHWFSDAGCHLDITIPDSDPPPQEKWPKPNDHGHSNQADVDTPKKMLENDTEYKYTVTISCDSGGSGTADPELVVAGGTKRHPGHGKEEGTRPAPQPQLSVVQIQVDANAGKVDRQSATVRKDQLVHWHATNGKIVRIRFDDPKVTVSCSGDTDCECDVSNLTVNHHYHYVIDVIDDHQVKKTIDPELVIAGGPFHPHHPRLKKE